MKNIRIIRISIPFIIVISAIVGCAITYSQAPHAALARIFIDIGALIALLSITYTLPKPELLRIDDIVDGLRDLARNRFDRRLPLREQDELFQVRQAFNELAGTLSDSKGSSLTHIRYNPMNRVEPMATPMPPVHHSLHPELGQVKTAPEITNAIAAMEEDFSISNITPVAIPGPILAERVEAKIEAEPEAPQAIQAKPETYPSDIGAADLFFLFERFKAAHEKPEESNIDFGDFMTTVHKTREDLMRAHSCRDVKFEVVNNSGAVALRPRLIR